MFKDGIKTITKSLKSGPGDLETFASDRAGWRGKVCSRVKSFSEAKIMQTRLKIYIRKKEITEKVISSNVLRVQCVTGHAWILLASTLICESLREKHDGIGSYDYVFSLIIRM